MYQKLLSLALLSLSFSASAFAQGYPNQGGLLNLFLNGSGSNCSVIVESSNTYHQMYVNGQFKGNYALGAQDYQLENMLSRYVSGGVCRLPSSGGYPAPYPGNYGGLLGSLMNGGSTNCSVVLESSRTYHQMYVNGEFKGNYEIGSQDSYLEFMIQRYVNSGVCHLRY